MQDQGYTFTFHTPPCVAKPGLLNFDITQNAVSLDSMTESLRSLLSLKESGVLSSKLNDDN